MLADAETTPELTDDQVTAFIADPATIPSHEIALAVAEVLEAEIASIQAQVDAAQIESNAKPLSPDRRAWVQRASYAAAMRRNELRRILNRDKEIRGTKHWSDKNAPEIAQAKLLKQERLKIEAEDRRLSKQLRHQEQITRQMELADKRRERIDLIRRMQDRLVEEHGGGHRLMGDFCPTCNASKRTDS